MRSLHYFLDRSCTPCSQRGFSPLAVILLAIGLSLSLSGTLSAQETSRRYAETAVATLQQWYDPAHGLWNTTGWWQSANALEAVIDYSARTGDTTYLADISTTFDRHRAGSFLNRFYDDEGWWALTWLKAYDLTHEPRYLAMAQLIFEDLKTGWDDTFGGGIWWSKDRKYKNAIANELFLTIAARLHQRTPGDKGKGSYLDWAQREWNWFLASGLINANNLINDGLTREGKNNNGTVWTYNQGVILGGLVAMYESTRNRDYLTKANAIANAALLSLVDANGILVEPCEKNSDCGGDGPEFKGVFMRCLATLQSVSPKRSYHNFIARCTQSLWQNNRNEMNQFGLHWGGSFDKADACRQAAALDAFNAALPARALIPPTRL